MKAMRIIQSHLSPRPLVPRFTIIFRFISKHKQTCVVTFSNCYSAKMTKNQKMLRKCLKILHVLDQLDEISDSDCDNGLVLRKIPKCGTLPIRNDPTFESGAKSTKKNTEPATLNYGCNPWKGPKDAQNPLEILTDAQFTTTYRFSKECVEDILQMISYGLTKCTNRGKPFPPMIELLITLQFLATGSFQSKQNFDISQPTVSRIIRKVTSLLAELKLRFIKIPDKTEFKKISSNFHGHFPEVFACIGSTHVAIKSPGKTVCDGYFNENGFYSFRVFMVCGPDLEFFEIISRWPGATRENKIFSISEVCQKFEFNQLEGVLLADNNYPMSNFVMTPIEHPRNIQDCLYNDCHRQTYNVEKAIDLWKRRFKCLQSVINSKEDTTQMIITATAVLHNIAIQRKQYLPPIESPSQSSMTSNHNQSKSDHKSNYFATIQDTVGLIDRDNFISKYFHCR